MWFGSAAAAIAYRGHHGVSVHCMVHFPRAGDVVGCKDSLLVHQHIVHDPLRVVGVAGLQAYGGCFQERQALGHSVYLLLGAGDIAVLG